MAKKSSFKIPGLSFSWKRAFGITKAKRKIAKATAQYFMILCRDVI